MNVAVVANRAATYARFVKFEHTVFSLPIIFAGALLAGQGWPSARITWLVLGAAVGLRTAALGINRIVDRQLDARNARTKNRELPSGTMRVSEAWGIVVIGSVVYGACAAAIAPICLYLAPVPAVLFAIYPWLKRMTPAVHLGLGVSWAMAPLGGWMAVNQSFAGWGPPVLLACFACLWVAGFDVIYATLDEHSDKFTGVKSLPVAIGKDRALLAARGMHALAWVLLCILSIVSLKTLWVLPWLAVISALLYWEHECACNVNLAFFRINAWLGFVVLGLVLTGTLVQ